MSPPTSDSHVHVAIDDKSVDRRADDRVLDVDLCLLDGGACLDDGGFRLGDGGFAGGEIGARFVHGGAGGFQIGRWNDLPGCEFLGPRQLRLCVFNPGLELQYAGLRAHQCCLRLGVCGLRHAQLRDERCRVQPRDDLACVHQ